ESKYVDRVVVSTEDDEIADICKSYGAEVIKRPRELAEDDVPDLPVFQHVIKTIKEDEENIPEIVLNLRPTCPLRSVQDIDKAISKLINTNCDSVRTIKTVKHHPYWMVKRKGDKIVSFLPDIDREKYYQRQLLPKAYTINGGVDVMRSHNIFENNTLYGKDIRSVLMPAERSVDIDTELDFYIAEQLMIKNEGNKNRR
ncbi:MAG: acylneuraminate cytidylyltransferase family protein, partial [Candidatus Thermoplasmatota archaeon]